MTIAAKIKAMKVGQNFTVQTETERQTASKDAKTLRRAGVIDFDIVTKAIEGGGWKVSAI